MRSADTPSSSAPTTARARARAQLTAEIKDAARRQLERDGVAELSLRAVARELGMASSAVYRYFPSRDELLTALIVDAYDSIADAAAHEDDLARARGDDHGTRWVAVCRAVRAWALAHPREWALVYGTPVAGYAAPVDTIEPASRIGRVLAGIAADARRDGAAALPAQHDTTSWVTEGVHQMMGGAAASGVDASHADGSADGRGDGSDRSGDDFADRALTMWIVMIGAINFELFGHLHNVVTDYDGYFDAAMVLAAEWIGVQVPRTAT
jgi:AcrR family transcriptional regulator